MDVVYKFVNPSMEPVDLEIDREYYHPTIHSLTLLSDEMGDILEITVIVPGEIIESNEFNR